MSSYWCLLYCLFVFCNTILLCTFIIWCKCILKLEKKAKLTDFTFYSAWNFHYILMCKKFNVYRSMFVVACFMTVHVDTWNMLLLARKTKCYIPTIYRLKMSNWLINRSLTLTISDLETFQKIISKSVANSFSNQFQTNLVIDYIT